MNVLFLIAGIISAVGCIGHFTIGKKDFLIPVLNSDIEEIPKKVMHSLFHYMSIILVISTLVLFDAAFNLKIIFENSADAILLLGIFFAGFALVQFIIAFNSSVSNGIFKIFQWILWGLIAVFSFLGI